MRIDDTDWRQIALVFYVIGMSVFFGGLISVWFPMFGAIVAGSIFYGIALCLDIYNGRRR